MRALQARRWTRGPTSRKMEPNRPKKPIATANACRELGMRPQFPVNISAWARLEAAATANAAERSLTDKKSEEFISSMLGTRWYDGHEILAWGEEGVETWNSADFFWLNMDNQYSTERIHALTDRCNKYELLIHRLVEVCYFKYRYDFVASTVSPFKCRGGPGIIKKKWYSLGGT